MSKLATKEDSRQQENLVRLAVAEDEVKNKVGVMQALLTRQANLQGAADKLICDEGIHFARYDALQAACDYVSVQHALEDLDN